MTGECESRGCGGKEIVVGLDSGRIRIKLDRATCLTRIQRDPG